MNLSCLKSYYGLLMIVILSLVSLRFIVPDNTVSNIFFMGLEIILVYGGALLWLFFSMKFMNLTKDYFHLFVFVVLFILSFINILIALYLSSVILYPIFIIFEDSNIIPFFESKVFNFDLLNFLSGIDYVMDGNQKIYSTSEYNKTIIPRNFVVLSCFIMSVLQPIFWIFYFKIYRFLLLKSTT